MWPFARKRTLDDDTAAWHLENLTWLLEQFGPAAFARTKLVLPQPGYFVTDGEKGHAFAVRIFDRVTASCGLAD
jgi:hypothetical protein